MVTGEAPIASTVMMPLPTGPAIPVVDPALPLQELSLRLEGRNWACEPLLDGGDDTVLRIRPPYARDDPARTVEVVVRDRGRGRYFAYAKTPYRSIASIDDLNGAVSALELVHGSEPPPVPPVPEELIRAAEWADGTA